MTRASTNTPISGTPATSAVGRRRSAVAMGTIVTVDVPSHATLPTAVEPCDALIERALDWFCVVERACSRFDPDSELRQLCTRVGEAVPVGPLLFEAVRFAVAVAEDTDGAFDPTVGQRMEQLGFDTADRRRRSMPASSAAPAKASWRDIHLDPAARTITLARPLLLDLGAVAKGLAVDLAAGELRPLDHFGIDAGGDIYVGGRTAADAPWSVGIRHPFRDDALLDTVRVSDHAVCTSGNYEKQRERGGAARHLVDARTGDTPEELVSVTVVAPSAMLADALATAAFVLGPTRGRELLDTHEVRGLLFTSALDRIVTGRCDDDGLPVGSVGG